MDMGRWRALTLLAVAMTLSMTTWFSAAAVLPALRARWDIADRDASFLTIAVQVGFVAGALVSALWGIADRVPGRRLFFAAALGAAVANGLLVVAPDLTTAIGLRFLTGVLAAGIYPVGLTIMTTHFRVHRGSALGVMIGALTLGSAMPHLLNALGGLQWQIVVTGSSAMTIAGGLVTLLWVREGEHPTERRGFDPGLVVACFRDPAVRLANVGYFGHMWELYAMWTWIAVFFRDGFPDTAAEFPSIAAFVAIGSGAAGAVGAGVLADRWGRTRTAALALAVSGASAAVIGSTYRTAPWLALSVAVIWGISIVADSAQFSAMVSEIARPAIVGTALELQLAMGFSLTALTIWLVPLAVEGVGWQWAFLVLVPGPLLGIGSMLALRARPESARIAAGLG